MTITNITLTLGHTINTGDYSSVRIELSADADIVDENDYEDAVARLRDQIAKSLHDAEFHTISELCARENRPIPQWIQDQMMGINNV